MGKVKLVAFGTGNDSAKRTPGDWKVVDSLHGDNLACVQIGDDESYTTGDMIRADANVAAAADDLLKVALAYEVWEAELVTNCTYWYGNRDLPTFNEELWGRCLEIQAMRNAAVAKANGKTLA